MPLSLTQPPVGSTTWGPSLNQNFASLQAAINDSSLITTTPLVAITAATTLTAMALGRLHVVSGLGMGFTVDLPAPAASPGGVIAFKVLPYAVANGQYFIRSPAGAIDASTALGIALLHGNTLQVFSDGSQWRVLSSSLNTAWIVYPQQIQGVGAAPTRPATYTEKAAWRRSGEDLEMRYFHQQNAPGAAGSGTYLYVLPIGSVNTALCAMGPFTSTTTNATDVGHSFCASYGSNGGSGLVKIYDATRLYLWVYAGSTMSHHSSTWYQISNTNLTMSFHAKVPIEGWQA